MLDEGPEESQANDITIDPEVYIENCNFEALHQPDLDYIIRQLLPRSSDYNGIRDLANADQLDLLRTRVHHQPGRPSQTNMSKPLVNA